MITDQEKQNALVLSLNIRAHKEQLERVKRLAKYCSCWLSEACASDDTETDKIDLTYLHDVVKAIEQKIKELETEKSIILQNKVTE